MKATLKWQVDGLKVAVLRLRGELRLALQSPKAEQVRKAFDASTELSNHVNELADLVEQMKE